MNTPVFKQIYYFLLMIGVFLPLKYENDTKKNLLVKQLWKEVIMKYKTSRDSV